MRLILIAVVAFLIPSNLFAQTWSQPQTLAGNGVAGQSYVDPNGNLFVPQQFKFDSSANSDKPLYQYLQSNDIFSGPFAYPAYQPNAISQKGFPTGVVQDLNGNRIVMWSIGGSFGGAPAMIYQKLDGTYGPNSVAGASDGAVSFRNNLIIALFQSPNGQVLVKEWSVGGDGTITARAAIPPIIAAGSGFGGCGAAIGINADGSAVAIFESNLQIRTASRSAAGVWSLDPGVIDQVTQNVESIGCLSGKASPGGRIIAAWWTTQVGLGESFDRGGNVRALVREPGLPFPNTYVTVLSNNPSALHSRRDTGVSVAMGLDGTAALLAYTEYCVNQDHLFTQGVLRLAGPGEDFVNAAHTKGISAMDSSADKIWGAASNHTPATAFAVENRKAVFGVRTVAYPNVGTNLRPSCGPAQVITEPQTAASIAVYYDAGPDILSSQEIQSSILEPGKTTDFRALIDAAMDFSGNAAIVRAPTFQQNSDVILRGDWQSGGAAPNAQPTATPTATATPAPTQPQVSFADDVKAKVAQAISLLATAKKALPTATTKKAKATKALIQNARKDLNGIIAILIGLLKTDAANISAANFKGFTDKNLKDIKAGLKAGASARLSKKDQAAGWSKAKKLLTQLTA